MDIKDAVFVFQMHEAAELLWHQRFHSHGYNEVELHYFVGGDGTFINGNKRYSISSGSLFLTTAGTTHQIEASIRNPLTYYAILLECAEHHELFNRLEKKNPFHLGTGRRFFFEEIRDKALKEEQELRISAAHQILGLLYGLAAEKSNPVQQKENIIIELALDYMQNHIFDKLTLSDIASHVKRDASYFVRLFKRWMNTTPMQYYANLRLEAARAFLANTNLSVKEVAAKLQYCSEFHFSKQFKQSTGLSPTAYRSRYLQKLGPFDELHSSKDTV